MAFRFLIFFSLIFGIASAQSDSSMILGIGIPPIDFLVHVDDDFIIEQAQVEKGRGRSCDSETFDRILEATHVIPTISPGGCAANTMRALAALGETCAYFGCIGPDRYGEHIVQNIRQLGIREQLRLMQHPTTKVLCMISPDGERTYLGFDPVTDIVPSPEDFSDVHWVYIESFALQNGSCVERGMQLAKEAGAKISFALCATFLIQEHKKRMLDLIANYVDIVFCNEDEVSVLTGLSPEEGCLKLQEICPIAIVTKGAAGCLVGHKGKILDVPAFQTCPVDTTGAGDYFAAGFLYGHKRGYPLSACARIGHRLGSAIIQVTGTTLSEERWEVVRAALKAEELSEICSTN